jgi:DNA-binding transcriptional regulator GbsR (MarR family)
MPDQYFEKQHFIEDIGLYFEQFGLARMAGRILGVLLISEPPEQSITDLCERLKASKSSISTNARLLDEMGLIERAASPVPRQVYYRFPPGGWVAFMRMRLRLYGAMHEVAERGLALLQEEAPELRWRLQEAHDMFQRIEEEMPQILARVEEARGIREI